MIINSLGSSIATIRKSFKLGREKFSQRIGCTPFELSLFETNEELPGLALLYKIAAISDVPVSEIFKRFEKTAMKKDVPDGAKIKMARKNAKFTQIELAAKSGVSNSQISNIELGHSIASIDTAKKLAKALGVEFEEILK